MGEEAVRPLDSAADSHVHEAVERDRDLKKPGKVEDVEKGNLQEQWPPLAQLGDQSRE